MEYDKVYRCWQNKATLSPFSNLYLTRAERHIDPRQKDLFSGEAEENFDEEELLRRAIALSLEEWV